MAGAQGCRGGVRDGPERGFESRWKKASNAFLCTKLCTTPSFKAGKDHAPREAYCENTLLVLFQASEEWQLPCMHEYKASRFPPEVTLRKWGCFILRLYIVSHFMEHLFSYFILKNKVLIEERMSD